MTELTHYEIIDDIAIVTMDDGKANAFGPNMIAAVNASLDRAADDARAVLLTGRPGLFSGGFDLKVIRSGDAEAAKTMRLAVSGQSRPLYPPPLICGPLFFFIGQINRRTHEFNWKSNADSSFRRAVAGDSTAF